MPRSKKPLSFEKALKKLESTVEALEDGQLSLDESLKLFEEGVQLARQCNRQLEDAQKKIEILTKDSEDLPRTKPFDTDDLTQKKPHDNS